MSGLPLVIALMVASGIMLRLWIWRRRLRRHGAVRLGSRARGGAHDEPRVTLDEDICGELRPPHSGDIPTLVNAVELPGGRGGGRPQVLALYLRAAAPIAGAALLDALGAQGLRFGAHRMFHRCAAGRDAPLFSVARMAEPGTFDMRSMATDSFSGLCLFMVLRRGGDNLARLQQMMDAAAALQAALGGTLMDGERQPLDAQAGSRYRALVRKFDSD